MAKYSVHNINMIYLILGNKCNFKCRYCLQGEHCDNEVAKYPTEDVYNYIEHLIKIRAKSRPKLRIIFWGGEPLIYLATIKEVVDRFGDSVGYALVTNGALLSKSFIEFANLHDISVTLSNDGLNTFKTRRLNFLGDKEFCKFFMQLKNRSIESVTSAYNYDYCALIDYLRERVPNTPVQIDPLKVTWDIPNDIRDVPLDDYEEKLRLVAKRAYLDILNQKVTDEVRLFLPSLKIISKLNDSPEFPKCGQFYKSLNIDCDGNIYPCHDLSLSPIGNIKDARIDVADVFENWLDKRRYDKCNSCEVNFLCAGGCPLETEFKEDTCKLNKVFYKVSIELAEKLIEEFEDIDLEV